MRPEELKYLKGDSSKIRKLGFIPEKKIIDAVTELKDLFIQKKLINKDNYHSLKWLKKKLKK